MIPQTDGTTKEIVRSYTPISGDHQPGYFDLLIKAYPQGNISQHVASLNLGDKIRIRGPKGAFIYTPNMVRRFGMIAGGTGITPMLQIIRAIIRGRGDGDKTEVDLIFANVNVEDILLKKDLDEISQDASIRVHFVLNNPPENWTGGAGFVTEEMINVRHFGPLTQEIEKLTMYRLGYRSRKKMSRYYFAALLLWLVE